MQRKRSSYSFFWSGFQFHQTLQNQVISYSKFRSIIPWNEIDRAFAISRNNNISYYYSKKDLKRDVEKGKKFFNQEFTNNYFYKVEDVCKGYGDFYKNIKKINFKKLSNYELYEHAVKAAEFWALTIGIFKATQAEGMHDLTKRLKKYFSEKEAAILMTPLDLDDVNKELIDWQNILEKPFSRKRLLKHLAEYPWLVFFHCTTKEAQDTINERFREGKKARTKRKIKKEKAELRRKQAEIIEKNQSIKKLVALLQKFALARMRMKSLWAGSDYSCIPLFQEIARRTGESIIDLEKIYILEDIRNVLMKGKKLSAVEKDNRKESFAVLWENGRVTYKSGREAERLAKNELGGLYKFEKSEEIRGTIANPGYAKGIARLLLSGDIEGIRQLRREFQEGQILITQMTQPNVVDIASKAGAIVANEGGMLSHAAIISRELRIPCIVGTHIATDVIKNGDLVEVDADKGFLKILKRSKK